MILLCWRRCWGRHACRVGGERVSTAWLGVWLLMARGAAHSRGPCCGARVALPPAVSDGVGPAQAVTWCDGWVAAHGCSAYRATRVPPRLHQRRTRTTGTQTETEAESAIRQAAEEVRREAEAAQAHRRVRATRSRKGTGAGVRLAEVVRVKAVLLWRLGGARWQPPSWPGWRQVLSDVRLMWGRVSMSV